VRPSRTTVPAATLVNTRGRHGGKHAATISGTLGTYGTFGKTPLSREIAQPLGWRAFLRGAYGIRTRATAECWWQAKLR
jgi:hypothetical protein